MSLSGADKDWQRLGTLIDIFKLLTPKELFIEEKERQSVWETLCLFSRLYEMSFSSVENLLVEDKYEVYRYYVRVLCTRALMKIKQRRKDYRAKQRSKVLG